MQMLLRWLTSIFTISIETVLVEGPEKDGWATYKDTGERIIHISYQVRNAK